MKTHNKLTLFIYINPYNSEETSIWVSVRNEIELAQDTSQNQTWKNTNESLPYWPDIEPKEV